MMDERNGNAGELPKGWVWTRLDEIAEINPKLLRQNIADDTDVTFLPMRCVEEQTGHIDLSIAKKFSEVRKGYTFFVNGDLLFAKITPCMENGKVAIAYGLENGIGFGSTEFHVIRLPEFVSKKFFFYFMVREDLRRDARKNMTGSAGQLRVPALFMQQIPVPFAPPSEQHRIVAKIEELFSDLDAGVAALQKTKAQLKRYRQAVLKAAVEGKLTAEWRVANAGKIEPASALLERIRVEREKSARRKSVGAIHELPQPDAAELGELPDGWCWVTVAEIGEVSGGLTKNPKRSKLPLKMPYLRVGNVYAGRLQLDEITSIGVYESEIEKLLLRKGDLLVVEGNGSQDQIGRVALWDGSVAACLHQNHIIKVRFNPVAIGKFSLLWLLSVEGRKQIVANSSSTSGLYTLSISKVSSLLVPLAPLAEQEQIVAEVERRLSVADEAEKTVDASLKQAERLRQSILKRAFAGKLVLQDPRDEPAERLLERIRAQRKLGNTWPTQTSFMRK